MATHMRRVFHSSLTKTGWIVSEGGRIVSRSSNQRANEAAAIAAGQKANQDGSLRTGAPEARRPSAALLDESVGQLLVIHDAVIFDDAFTDRGDFGGGDVFGIMHLV